MTIDTGAVCRSWTVQSGAGATTHTAGVTLLVGDGTAGAGNVALAFPTSGWTYTLGSTTTSAITFVSTSPTQQTVNFGNQATGNVTYNATSDGSWLYTGGHLCGTAAIFALTQGTLDTNGHAVTGGRFNSLGIMPRILTLGASAITLGGSGTPWNMLPTGLTLNATSATITLTTPSPSFEGGGFAYGTVLLTGSTNAVVRGTNTFTALTRTGTAAKLNTLGISDNQVITGTLTLTGQSAINRLLVFSATLGTPVTLTAAVVTAAHVDFQDITGAGAATWDVSAVTGGSGNCGGNSFKALGNAAFTPAATQTSTGTASFAWSTHGWTSRVPLPQDDVVVNNAFVAGRTVTLDMPRAGKNISFFGATGTPAWAVTTATTIYGSITKIAGMTQSGTTNVILSPRTPATVTNAGIAWTNPLFIDAFGTTVTLLDAFVSTSTKTHRNGSWIDNGFSTTFTAVTSNSGLTRALTRTGAMTLTGTGGVLTITSTGLTYTGTGSSITINETTQGASKTFAGGGITTYGALVLSGKNIIITGANTFASIALNNLGDTTGVTFPASTITTVGAFTSTASAGNVAKMISSGSGTPATLSKSSGLISVDYVSIKDSAVIGGAKAYAGVNSVNVSGNSEWVFTTVPSFKAAWARRANQAPLGGGFEG